VSDISRMLAADPELAGKGQAATMAIE
jgi:hypothetical protein